MGFWVSRFVFCVVLGFVGPWVYSFTSLWGRGAVCLCVRLRVCVFFVLCMLVSVCLFACLCVVVVCLWFCGFVCVCVSVLWVSGLMACGFVYLGVWVFVCV